MKSFPLFSRMGGKVVNLRRFVRTDTKRWSCFNPSIGQSPNGYAIAFRSSNYVVVPDSGELLVDNGEKIMNQVWFTETNENFELLNLRQLDFSDSPVEMKRGVEDAKLFWRNNKWQFTGVAMERDIPKARIITASIDTKSSKVKDLKLYDGVDANRPEKNWMIPYEKNPNFDFVYGPNSIVKGDKVISSFMTDAKMSRLRGNTNLLTQEDGTYLALMHILYPRKVSAYNPRTFGIQEGLLKNYTHIFVRIDTHGQIVEMGEEFQFVSAGIEFAAGLVEMGDYLVISFGKDDVSSHIGVINKKKVLGTLKKV